jgi:hypothetical protein
MKVQTSRKVRVQEKERDLVEQMEELRKQLDEVRFP